MRKLGEGRSSTTFYQPGPLARQGPGRCRQGTDARCRGLAANTGRDGVCVESNAKDLPIDGVDASAFMLGKSNTTGRDSYMFFGADGELMSINWKFYKTVFRYTVDSSAIQSAYLKPQLPMQYDLSSDPHEDSNVWSTDLTQGWMFAPNFRIIAEDERNLKEYPNIKVGEDFRGYQKRITKSP
jgi:hypothetical protein